MDRSYETPQDQSWTSESDEATDQNGNRPRAIGAILAGAFAVVGGGLLAAGPYLPFVGSGDNAKAEVDLVIWPKPLLLVALAGVVVVAGLLMLIQPRTTMATTMAGLVVAPAATVAALQAPPVLRRVVSSSGRDQLELGGWLITAGTGVALLAALVALFIVFTRLGPGRGPVIPLLGVVSVAGLVQWWMVSPLGPEDTPLIRYFDLDNGGSVWPGVAVLSALAIIVGAVLISSARCGSAAVGVALGATLAVGMELGARYLIPESDLQKNFGMELRFASVVLTGVTAGVLLLLTIALAISTGRLAADTTEMAMSTWQSDSSDGGGSWGSSQSTDDQWSSASATGTSWPESSSSSASSESSADATYSGQSEWSS